MAGLAAAGQITSYVMSKHAIVGLSLALRSEAAGRGVGVLAVCPTAVETPILDKGSIGGFVGRDFYKMGQRSSTFSSADELAKDTLRAIERNKALLVWPRQARTGVAVLPPGTWSAATNVDRVRQQAAGSTGSARVVRPASYRVVRCGTGNIGAVALKAIIGHPNLELIGLDRVGITATNDWSELLALDADCLMAPNGRSRTARPTWPSESRSRVIPALPSN